jgi:two-component system, NarL family, response regulator NreC
MRTEQETGSGTIRVLLVDEKPMIREELRFLLRSAADMTVVGAAGSGPAAFEAAGSEHPDVVVLGLDQSTGDLEALRELASGLPAARIVVLTLAADPERSALLLEAGARGYVSKDAASRELMEAIRVVAAGEIYAPQPPPTRTARERFHSLSDREQTVLRLMAEGYSGAEVARQLRISSKTVDAYKHRVREKLGLEHRTEYVRFALEAGILTP